MGNPYTQVALTYVRRWRLIGNGVLLLAVISPAAASIVFEKGRLQDLLLQPFIPFLAAYLFIALASHVRQQFAHCRSHLMPGFRRVQVNAEAKGATKLTVRTRTGYFPVVRAAKKGAAGKK